MFGSAVVSPVNAAVHVDGRLPQPAGYLSCTCRNTDVGFMVATRCEYSGSGISCSADLDARGSVGDFVLKL